MEQFTIENKTIYVVENHHEILEAWAIYRSRLLNPPLLFSLDHHRDTKEAFINHICTAYQEFNRTKQEEQIRAISYSDTNSIHNAISLLNKDEHIDAAINSNIVSRAFVFQYDTNQINPPSVEMQKYYESVRRLFLFPNMSKPQVPERPHTYLDYPIFEIGGCYVGCEKEPHDDECRLICFNQAIESDFLSWRLGIVDEMLPGLGDSGLINQEYILDIDLDYFHTCESIQPRDTEVFHNMIRSAGIITIATEEFYVNEWRRFDPQISVEFLKEKLFNHIQCALE